MPIKRKGPRRRTIEAFAKIPAVLERYGLRAEDNPALWAILQKVKIEGERRERERKRRVVKQQNVSRVKSKTP